MISSKKYRIPGIIFLVLSASAAWAQDDAPMMIKSQSGIALEDGIDWSMCTPDNIAVGGYDLVSYRDANGPVAGSTDFSTDYDDKIYQFSSQANLDTFLENPENFLPAYSGFCAVTLALGRVTCPEYTNFKFEDGKLLLFEVTGFTNGRTLWNSDSKTFRQQADNNFERLTEQR